MAVTSTIERNLVFIRLNLGVNANGVRIIRNVSLGPLKTTAFDENDKTKVYNIVNAFMPCAAYSLYQVQLLTSTQLEED